MYFPPHLCCLELSQGLTGSFNINFWTSPNSDFLLSRSVYPHFLSHTEIFKFCSLVLEAKKIVAFSLFSPLHAMLTGQCLHWTNRVDLDVSQYVWICFFTDQINPLQCLPTFVFTSLPSNSCFKSFVYGLQLS